MKITKDLNGFLRVKKTLNLIKKVEKTESSEEVKDDLNRGNKVDKKA